VVVLVALVTALAVMMLVFTIVAVVAMMVLVFVVMAIVTVVVLVLVVMAVVAVMMLVFAGVAVVTVVVLVFVRVAVAGDHDRRGGSRDNKGQQQGNERIPGSHVSSSPRGLLGEQQTFVDPLRFVNQKSRPTTAKKSTARCSAYG
jgi:hypothetical protein